jgi:hypothetical protein
MNVQWKRPNSLIECYTQQVTTTVVVSIDKVVSDTEVIHHKSQITVKSLVNIWCAVLNDRGVKLEHTHHKKQHHVLTGTGEIIHALRDIISGQGNIEYWCAVFKAKGAKPDHTPKQQTTK